ncbi:hypothetical protein Q3G72_007429 [Acer saccharum]|nr:hypothetical protein Q3G72_007429 [Acer saccharum]
MTTRSCATCRYQRKKHPEICITAPYFHVSKIAKYQNAQKVFGVTNIEKMLAKVSPQHKRATVEPIIIEGSDRYNILLLGSQLDLRSQVHSFKNQLEALQQKYLAYLCERERQQTLEIYVNIPQFVRVRTPTLKPL